MGRIKVPNQPPLGGALCPIMIVGQAPGEEEEKYEEPYVGGSGRMLRALLAKHNMDPDSCWLGNVCQYRPPHDKFELLLGSKGNWAPELEDGILDIHKAIEEYKPTAIVALGQWALWALTRETGIDKWRGSIMENCETILHYKIPCPVIPIFHTARALRQYDLVSIIELDLKQRVLPWFQNRGPKKPKVTDIIRPTYPTVMRTLWECTTKQHVSIDIETFPSAKLINTIGIAWSKTEAMSIPILLKDYSPYFTPTEEANVIAALYRLAWKADMQVSGTNFNYDNTYFQRHYGFILPVTLDVETMGHILAPEWRRSLAFWASARCDWYCYWKEDNKEWNKIESHSQHWLYNCKDVRYTWECAEVMHAEIKRKGLSEQFQFQRWRQQKCLELTLRGIKLNKQIQLELIRDYKEERESLGDYLEETTGIISLSKDGKSRWYQSPKQTGIFFYDWMGVKPIKNKSGSRTTDDKALPKVAAREPLLKPIIERLSRYRTNRVLSSTVLESNNPDGRVHSNWKANAAITYRYGCAKDVFNNGYNLQNQTEDLRVMLVPDEGYVMFYSDLPQADARTVAWTSQDQGLMDVFLDPSRDLHNENCIAIFGRLTPKGRKLAKSGVHAANYVVGANTLADTLGIDVAAAEAFLYKWFAAHPAIKEWHNRVKWNIRHEIPIKNAYGFQATFRGRANDVKVLQEAIAWEPQSNTALAIDSAWRKLEELVPEAQVLAQGHDALLYQLPDDDRLEERLTVAKEAFNVVVPYPVPMPMQADLHWSRKSWGEMEKRAWPI